MRHSYQQAINELIVVDVLPNHTPEQVCNLVHTAWIENNSPKTIIAFTDIIGATPSNGLHLWLSKGMVYYRGFSGVNIPILLSAINHKDHNIEMIVEKIKYAAQYGTEQL